MPPRVDGPVQTQLAIPVPDGVLGSKRGGTGGRLLGRRRIFVQTDTGSVLGIELDRDDNVQTVKKKMQTMLNVPTEQTALVFGDTVFKSDLSRLRNDSPLLLTRDLQRSLSTPCIFPPQDFQAQVDRSRPFEVVGSLRCCPKMKGILKDILKAIECGVEPMAASGGLGGAYYFRNSRGESIAIVKPNDEEPFAPNNPKGFIGKALGQPGLKRAVRVGETGVREVAAYLLDHEHFAKVPPTVLVKVSHNAFNINDCSSLHKGHGKECPPLSKIASCQQFVPHDFDASDHGASRFSVSAVHRIGILDIRIFNTDRHAGNILVRNVGHFDSQGWSRSSGHVNEALELIPIDHGLCLPEALEDPYFEWLHWPQASLAFSDEELDYIQRLDENRDVDMLHAELPMLREACLRMLLLSTTVLKKAAAAGLCLAEIGELMSRDGMEEASQLELLCMEARLQVENELSACGLVDGGDSISDLSAGDDELPDQFEVELDSLDGSLPSLARLNDSLSSSNGLEEGGVLCSPKKGHKAMSQNGFRYNNGVSVSVANKPGKGAGKYRSMGLALASPRAPRKKDRSLFQVPSKAGVLPGEEDESMPLAHRTSSTSEGLGYLSPHHPAFAQSSEVKYPRRYTNHVNGTSRTLQDSCPSVEEEEVNVLAETDLRASMSSCKIDVSSPRGISYRSVSFSDQKQRYPNCPDRRDIGGLPTSEMTGKLYSSGSSNPLCLGDMNDEEWAYFMDHFQNLFQEVLATKCNQNASLKQRLGISCQF